MKNLFTLIIFACLIQSCGTNNDKKYELKSPCVSAKSAEVIAAPCQRRPVNKDIS